jgi:hypothetical protein
MCSFKKNRTLGNVQKIKINCNCLRNSFIINKRRAINRQFCLILIAEENCGTEGAVSGARRRTSPSKPKESPNPVPTVFLHCFCFIVCILGYRTKLWGYVWKFLHRINTYLGQNRNQLRWVAGLFTGHCHLKGHLFKLGLTDNPICERCQEKMTQSHIHAMWLWGHSLLKI